MEAVMKSLKGILVLATMLLVTIPAVADESQADQQAMMEMMIKLGSPGEGHKKLEPFAGTFDVDATFWMAPGEEPMSSTGKANHEWILGGRYLFQEFEGDFMGEPFHGQGITGYDNFRNEYFGTWIDSMSTGMMLTKGQVEGNVWTYTGSMDDTMAGKTVQVIEKITLHGSDHHVMEMWSPAPDGEMFKSMEIHYRRTK
jgi:hypothetical protein